ncbi:MAG: hypothetical protein R2911_28485 [Caldilineaceae bacterium]
MDQQIKGLERFFEPQFAQVSADLFCSEKNLSNLCNLLISLVLIGTHYSIDGQKGRDGGFAMSYRGGRFGREWALYYNDGYYVDFSYALNSRQENRPDEQSKLDNRQGI